MVSIPASPLLRLAKIRHAACPPPCAAAVHIASQLPRLPLPAGPRSSALVGGYTSWHRELETALAQLKGTEGCLLFPTGFAANLAVASALCQEGGVVVLSDELNHASIVDGARLGRRGGSRLLVYRHNDMEHLEELLRTQCPPGVLHPPGTAAAAAAGGRTGGGSAASLGQPSALLHTARSLHPNTSWHACLLHFWCRHARPGDH